MKFGSVNVELVNMGCWRPDGGSMFGVIPKPIWERWIKPDERNRIRLATNCLLIESKAKRAIIETGNGTKWGDKETNIFAFEHNGTMKESLEAYNTATDDLDFVINTHLHFDHAGGNTFHDGDETLPTFNKAKYIMSEDDLNEARVANERNRGSLRSDDFEPLFENASVELIKGAGDAEVMPAVKLLHAPGHTQGHRVALIGDDGGEQALFMADLVPTAGHVSLPSIMAFDMEPMVTLETKKKWLKAAAENKWTVFLYHEPVNPIGNIIINNKGAFEWKPLEKDE